MSSTFVFPNQEHPYMRKIYCVAPNAIEEVPASKLPAKGKDQQNPTKSSPSQVVNREFALLQCATEPESKSLFLAPLRPLLQVVDELSDDLVTEALHLVDHEIFPASLEYPHLYVILDHPERPNFMKSIAYLRKQQTVTFVLDRFLEYFLPPDRDQPETEPEEVPDFLTELSKGTGFARLDGVRDHIRQLQRKRSKAAHQQNLAKFKNPQETSKSATSKTNSSSTSSTYVQPTSFRDLHDPACMCFATRHFIFVIDLFTVPIADGLEIVRSILEDPTVHKVVYDFAFDDQYLQHHFQIRTVNWYDVVATERVLEERRKLPSLESYSMMAFRKRYRERTLAFRTFPDRDFLPCRAANPDNVRHGGRIRDLSDSWLSGILKQLLYLDLIKRCQLEIFYHDSALMTEVKLALLYDYPDDFLPVGMTKAISGAATVRDDEET